MFDTKYTKKCENCGKEHSIYTQDDNNPEYYTDVYIKCSCGARIEFKLPVN